MRGDILNVVDRWCRWSVVAVWRQQLAGPRGPPPCPTVPLDCCCTLVSTEGMNIFLNFADSITLSLTIIILGSDRADPLDAKASEGPV